MVVTNKFYCILYFEGCSSGGELQFTKYYSINSYIDNTIINRVMWFKQNINIYILHLNSSFIPANGNYLELRPFAATYYTHQIGFLWNTVAPFRRWRVSTICKMLYQDSDGIFSEIMRGIYLLKSYFTQYISFSSKSSRKNILAVTHNVLPY